MSSRRRTNLTVNNVIFELNRGRFAAARWDTLGVMLDVPPETIDVIRVDNVGRADSQLMAVITYWINNCNASWEILADALEQTGYGNLANSICNRENSGSGHTETVGERSQMRRQSQTTARGNKWILGGLYWTGAVLVLVMIGVWMFREYQARQNKTPQKTNEEKIKFPRTLIQNEKELVSALYEVAEWSELCLNLGVKRVTVEELKHNGKPAYMNRRDCLTQYYDSGLADWAEVVKVVASPPILNKKLACRLADKYIEGIDDITCLAYFNS